MARMKELEEENRRLKKMYIEEKLKAEIVTEYLAKKYAAASPPRRREMAKEVVALRCTSIRLDCSVFTVSKSCYRYKARRNTKNEQIADWLMRLTDNNRSWGSGLCYLYLRNVRDFQ